MRPSPSGSHLPTADPAYPRLKDYLIRSTGLSYYADKDADLAARIGQRLATLGVPNCTLYLALLEDGKRGEAELDVLIKDLTIGETFFFRHREMFDALRSTVFPDLIRRNQHSRQLRIWSAGCSTGAEAYSIAILLRRDMGEQVSGWDITILGTDINREFLARAGEGRFEEWSFRSSSDEFKRSCFVRSGTSWLLVPEYKEGVSFQYHNLVTHPFPSLVNNLFAFDLILCRNVTIYFSLEIVRRLIDHFHQTLVEGGWLLVGHAEPNMELFRSFRTVNVPGAVLYQKNKEVPGVPGWLSLPLSGADLPSPSLGNVQPWVPPQFPWEIQAPPAVSADPLPPVLPPVEKRFQPAPVLSDLDMIRSLSDRAEWDKAAQCCEKLLERERLNPVGYFYHALVLEQMGRHAESENALRRAIYLDRNFILAHYYLGLLLQRTGRQPLAARSFRNALQLLTRTPEDKVFSDGDGITAGELMKLTQMNLEVLEGP